MPNFKIVKTFINTSIFILCSFAQVKVKAWEVDFSRRQTQLKSSRLPASITEESQLTKEKSSLIPGFLSEALEPAAEIVILLTEKGFVPETVRVRKGQAYQVHVVNVNSKVKNSSFMMDSFSEHHGIFWGDQKTFTIQPKIDGVFSFVSPETGSQGRLVVYSSDDSIKSRNPASSK